MGFIYFVPETFYVLVVASYNPWLKAEVDNVLRDLTRGNDFLPSQFNVDYDRKVKKKMHIGCVNHFEFLEHNLLHLVDTLRAGHVPQMLSIYYMFISLVVS